MPEIFSTLPESQSAVTTGTGKAISLTHAEKSTMWVKASGTISGGEVAIETADSPEFTGTWYVHETITPVTNKTIPVFITNPVGAVRSRVTSNITGGGTISTPVQAFGGS